MQLSNIKEYLEKYKNKLTAEEEKKNSIISIIFKKTGILLSEKEIIVVKGNIIIKASPVVKNEIFLHKEKLLNEIKMNGRNDIFEIQ